MTQAEKAQLYENIVRQGDVVQRELSKLKSTNINGNTPEEEKRIVELQKEMAMLEAKMNNLLGSM